jgi:hypothetical protein
LRDRLWGSPRNEAIPPSLRWLRMIFAAKRCPRRFDLLDSVSRRSANRFAEKIDPNQSDGSGIDAI